jgi:restriction system protein
MFDNANRLWVVHISNNAQLAQRAREEGFICIGWGKLGDLSPYDTREKMKARYHEVHPTKSAAHVRSSYGQVYKFAHEMEVGEPVVYPIKGGRDVMIGRIAGPYQWSDDEDLQAGDYANIRKVDWIKRVPRVDFSPAALSAFGAFSSVCTADDHLDEVRAVLAGETFTPTPPSAKTLVTAEGGDDAEEAEAQAQNAADEVTQATKDYLLRRWSRTAQDFEEVTAAVFRAIGYTARTQQGTGDMGVDVIAHKDPLGVESITLKVQCKSGTSTSGGPDIQKLRGTLMPGEKGVFISLGGFAKDAQHTERNDPNLILIDADRFVELFLDHYPQLSAEMRHRFPLQQVYGVAGGG